MIKNNYDEDYNKKIQTLEYRHVTKKVNGKKKYYYIMEPGFYTSIKKDTSQKSSKYTGELNKDNERHGWGRYEVINGGVYEGYWKNGFKNGNGISYYKTGFVQYEGEWQCGEPHGIGKVFNQNGKLCYEGIFVNGKSKNGIYFLDYKNK